MSSAVVEITGLL